MEVGLYLEWSSGRISQRRRRDPADITFYLLLEDLVWDCQFRRFAGFLHSGIWSRVEQPSQFYIIDTVCESYQWTIEKMFLDEAPLVLAMPGSETVTETRDCGDWR